ncbi:MAG: hypothetical protein QW097_02575 [archaeon]
MKAQIFTLDFLLSAALGLFLIGFTFHFLDVYVSKTKEFQNYDLFFQAEDISEFLTKNSTILPGHDNKVNMSTIKSGCEYLKNSGIARYTFEVELAYGTYKPGSGRANHEYWNKDACSEKNNLATIKRLVKVVNDSTEYNGDLIVKVCS